MHFTSSSDGLDVAKRCFTCWEWMFRQVKFYITYLRLYSAGNISGPYALPVAREIKSLDRSGWCFAQPLETTFLYSRLLSNTVPSSDINHHFFTTRRLVPSIRWGRTIIWIAVGILWRSQRSTQMFQSCQGLRKHLLIELLLCYWLLRVKSIFLSKWVAEVAPSKSLFLSNRSTRKRPHLAIRFRRDACS